MANKQSAVSNPLIITIVVAVVIATGGFWYYQKLAHRKPVPVVLTPEAKAYVRNLKITDSNMKANESFAGVIGVVEITGNIKNAGERNLNFVDIYCNFYDSYNQLVLREKSSIVGTRMGGLKPGETKAFRLAFDNIPPSWNQSIPGLISAQMQFAN